MTKRTYIKDLNNLVGGQATINAWVDIRRDQGRMIFFDFRDASGKVQGVVLPKSLAMETAKEVRSEWVLEVNANVNKRPEKNIQKDKINGDIELEILEIKVLNKAETLPFSIDSDTRVVDESVRLKYRYLDLRSERLRKNIINKARVQSFIRNFLEKESFIETETPLLTAPTPEGSRSFVVPSRIYNGKFYSLPQSPQQYKQLLMVAGFEKYFQFARCMRDEDTRGDRQPEFTQLDMELSFVSEEEIMNLNERLLIEVVSKFYPEKKIQTVPFPRMSYKDAMEKYGNDRPDIRENKEDPNLLAFLWITDFPAFEKTGSDNVDGTGEWTFTHNPFTRVRDEFMADYMEKKNISSLISTQYDITLNGFEIGGGGLRSYEPEMLKKTFEIMGYSEDKITENFGHILEAFKYGTPPHGGIAWGFDRLMMLLENEPNIREVIPFAKTGDGKDLMMNSPSGVSTTQLLELGVNVIRK